MTPFTYLPGESVVPRTRPETHRILIWVNSAPRALRDNLPGGESRSEAMCRFISPRHTGGPMFTCMQCPCSRRRLKWPTRSPHATPSRTSVRTMKKTVRRFIRYNKARAAALFKEPPARKILPPGAETTSARCASCDDSIATSCDVCVC